jgi:hypothetical protein
MRRLLVISLLAAMPSYLAAQRMGFAGRSSFGAGSNGHAGYAGHFRGSYYPYALDSLYPDYVSNTDDQPPQPPVFPQAPAVPLPPPAQPLLIELQGTSYVQISGEAPSQAHILDQPRVQEPARSASAEPQPQQPTLLVFRDGHHLEVSNYTIADGVLYAQSDYYRNGQWNQKIELASLNLDETVSTNRSRGLTFRLPNAPNVIIVGP